ncbi:MAG: NAD(P)-dependent oxidoreductase, partial [Myxococcales bacterium]|nr:NAD(P)-dependent oxidoreductase [Myxococcales bacterium]
ACEKPPVLVLLSSMAAVGPAASGAPLTEAAAAHPVTEYGRSKQAAEGAARGYAGRVPISIVRPGVVFGERDRETLPYFQLARKGWLLAFGPRDEAISVIHVADLAHIVEVICLHGERLSPEGPPDKGVYFAAKDQTSFGELGGLLAEIYRREVRVLSAPGVLGFGAAALLELTGRMLGRSRERVDLSTVRTAAAGAWVCDPSKALALPIKLRMTLRERLQQTAVWYREAGWL